MRSYKLLSAALAVSTLLGGNPSYAAKPKDNQTSCKNSNSSKKSQKRAVKGIVSAAGIFAVLAMTLGLSKRYGRSSKTQDIPKTPGETKVPEVVTDEKADVNPAKRQENWMKILPGEEVPHGCFIYTSGREFRQDTDENLENHHDFIQIFFPTYDESNYANQDLNIDSCRELWKKVANEESQSTLKLIRREMQLNFIRMLLFWGFKVTIVVKNADNDNTATRFNYSSSDSKNLFSNGDPDWAKDRITAIKIENDDTAKNNWKTDTNDHNRLRITRVLNSLQILELKEEYKSFRRGLSILLQNRTIKDIRDNNRIKGTSGKYWDDTYKTKPLSNNNWLKS